MDTFENVRCAAVKLHRSALAKGAEPLDPASLVRCSLDSLELEAVSLAADDPTLRGAKALLDWQTGTICYAKTGTDGDRAILVAHEIGHACIHTSNCTCTSNDIDPTQPTEPARVSAQRVEDYGVRERRELQANVFAREFLFPRWLAKQLYLRDAMSARTIAERMGLPINLIRQQLLDALLLPSPQDVSPVVQQRANCVDSSQEGAIAHRNSPYQLQAGPGTGKTGTLVRRVLSLISEGIDPSSILVLTFSNRAAGELAERIASAHPDAAHQVWIGTFHSFGLDLLRRHHDRLGLPSNPSVFDRSDAVDVLEDILPTLRLQHYRNLSDPVLILRDVLGAISRAKDEMADAAHYRSLSDAMLNEAGADPEQQKAAEKCVEVARVYEFYERALAERGAVDFGDLVMKPTILLENDPHLRGEVQRRHSHILVDEYQDVNRASARMLLALAGDCRRVWVVGDARQSIYRFRGASSLNMVMFGTDFPGAITGKLSVNYRSSQEVVDSFVGFASHMSASDGMLDLALTADRGALGIKPELRSFEYPHDEEAGIAASVKELEKAGVRLREQAVLCRSNTRLNQIAAVLQRHGIPVLYLGSLFEREEVRDLLALMSLMVDSSGGGLARIAAMSRYDLSLEDVSTLLKYLGDHQSRNPVSTRLLSLVHLPGLSLTAGQGIRRLAQDLNGFDSMTTPWELLSTYALERSDALAVLSRSDAPVDRIRAIAIWQFLNFTREQSFVGNGLPIQRTLDRVRRLTLLADDRDLRQIPAEASHIDAVRMMTVHGSKGLEFAAVHLPGLTKASFPASNQGQKCPPPTGLVSTPGSFQVGEEVTNSHAQEEECLFFVAISRAQTHLRLYRARRMRSGNNRSSSHFLDWLPAHMVNHCDVAATSPLPSDTAEPGLIPVTFPKDWKISHRKLSQYDRCPRRFFYTHILNIRSARESTPFSRSMDCLYDLVRWVASNRPSGNPSLEEALHELESTWQAKGPVGHAYEEDYKSIVVPMLVSLLRFGEGHMFEPVEALTIEFPTGRIVVEPDEMARMADGKLLLRVIRPGHKRSDEYDRLEYVLCSTAGSAHFAEGFVLRALFLTESLEEDVPVIGKKSGKIRQKVEAMITDIVGGKYPIAPDAITCPRCPHFFICAAEPRGSLTLEKKEG